MPAFLLCVHTNTINKNIDIHTIIRYPDREDKGTARDTSSVTSPLISKHFTHYTRSLWTHTHMCRYIFFLFYLERYYMQQTLSQEAIYKRERLQTCLFRVGSSHERERAVLFVLLSPSCMTLVMLADVFLRQGSKEQRTCGVDGWEGRQQEWSGWKHQRQSIRCPHQQLPRQHIANDSGVIFGDETGLPTGRVRAPSQAGGCCSPTMKTSFESKTASRLATGYLDCSSCSSCGC